MNVRRAVGAHEVWLEQDVVCIRYQGTISKAEMIAIVDYINAAVDCLGEVFVLVDSNHAALPSTEVRRVMVERGYSRVKGLARYQRSPATNSWMSLLLQNAARLIGRRTTRIKVVETEAEARAWLDELRSHS